MDRYWASLGFALILHTFSCFKTIFSLFCLKKSVSPFPSHHNLLTFVQKTFLYEKLNPQKESAKWESNNFVYGKDDYYA